MATVAIVGGGMAGLATALFSGRRGHEVLIVERGAGPPTGAPDELVNWDRRGVAQAHFAHYFKARSTRAVREEAPDLLAALLDAGITESDVRFGPAFAADTALDARRLVYEGVLRRVVSQEPAVTFVAGRGRGYLVDIDTVPARVTGLRLADGSELRADVIVDAGGRRSVSSRWLKDAGLPGLQVEEHPSNQRYFTRHYRLRDGHPRPAAVPFVLALPYGMVLVFGGDNGTFSLALALSAHDPYATRIRDSEIFDRLLGALPATAVWLEHADPVSEVHAMGGLSNRRRRFVVDGAPVAAGLALVGDSALYTNPALGQGVSLSFWMAQRLADSVDRFVVDPVEAAIEYQTWIDEVPTQWFGMQVAADVAATRQFTAGLRGAGYLPPADDRARFSAAVMALRREDEHVNQIVSRIGHLLEYPAVLGDDPDIAAKVEAYLATGPAFPTDEGPLPRRDFEALLAR